MKHDTGEVLSHLTAVIGMVAELEERENQADEQDEDYRRTLSATVTMLRSIHSIIDRAARGIKDPPPEDDDYTDEEQEMIRENPEEYGEGMEGFDSVEDMVKEGQYLIEHARQRQEQQEHDQ